MEYKDLKTEYETFKKVFCPFLKEDVSFNSKGLRHLFYKNGQRKRSEIEVVERFNFIKNAKDILSITTTLQEKEIRVVRIMFYAFIAIMEEVKLKVVIKKDGDNGGWYFYSVIPHYITSPKRDTKIKDRVGTKKSV